MVIYFRWTPHPVIVTIGDNRDYIRVLLYSYYCRVGGPPNIYIYIKAQGGSHILTSRRKCLPYSYMDPLGMFLLLERSWC